MKKTDIISLVSELEEVVGKVVRPDLVLVEGKLKQQASIVEASGVVRRVEYSQDFSRQLNMPGTLPGHHLQVEVETKNVGANTLVSLFVTAESDFGIVAVRTDEFMLKEMPLPGRPELGETEPHRTVAPGPVEDTAAIEDKIKRQLEEEFSRRYLEAELDLQSRLREEQARTIESHLTRMNEDMQSELNRRWKQQLSAFQQRHGFRGSVEFGSTT